jgi:hypothetical protein
MIAVFLSTGLPTFISLSGGSVQKVWLFVQMVKVPIDIKKERYTDKQPDEHLH